MIVKLMNEDRVAIVKCDGVFFEKREHDYEVTLVANGNDETHGGIAQISIYDNGHLIEHKDIKEEL